MPERFIGAVLKTVVRDERTVGSNPTSSFFIYQVWQNLEKYLVMDKANKFVLYFNIILAIVIFCAVLPYILLNSVELPEIKFETTIGSFILALLAANAFNSISELFDVNKNYDKNTQVYRSAAKTIWTILFILLSEFLILPLKILGLYILGFFGLAYIYLTILKIYHLKK